jgi:anti-sigma regulatory factor (Ser/Thr protein kinase)
MRLKIELESAVESMAIVRANVRQMGRIHALDEPVIEDLVTAISEACNNVVLHAYPERTGTFVLLLSIGESSIQAEIRDCGRGARTLASSGNGLGLGVALIRKLADTADFESRPGSGMTVRMGFPRNNAGTPVSGQGLPEQRKAASGGRSAASWASWCNERSRVATRDGRLPVHPR